MQGKRQILSYRMALTKVRVSIPRGFSQKYIKHSAQLKKMLSKPMLALQ